MKVTVTAQAFNRYTGIPAPFGTSREEKIDTKTNKLFKDANCILKIKEAYERFWNDSDIHSEHIVFVSQIKIN